MQMKFLERYIIMHYYTSFIYIQREITLSIASGVEEFVFTSIFTYKNNN